MHQLCKDVYSSASNDISKISSESIDAKELSLVSLGNFESVETPQSLINKESDSTNRVFHQSNTKLPRVPNFPSSMKIPPSFK